MPNSLALLLALAVTPAATPYQHLGPTPPPHGLPAITSYRIASTDIRAGQTITGSVTTSDNVDYVEVRIDYRNSPMQRTSPGHFALSYKVPWFLPPWLHRGYTLQIIARTADGVETKKEIPITVH